MTTSIEEMAKKARIAARLMQACGPTAKSAALEKIKEVLRERKEEILKENEKDKEHAEKEVAAGKLSSQLLKRLDLAGNEEEKYLALLEGVSNVVDLPDPTNRITLATKLAPNLTLTRVTCPIGVILIIFEARPEVVVQISCLAIKSGNAVILKGGKEAAKSNVALHAAVQEGLARANSGIPVDAVQLVSTHAEIASLLQLDEYIDLVIPRGSNALVKHIQGSTRIPVLGHADGLCSVYVHEDADLETAISVAVDSKTNYPAACNSAETLLIHAAAASRVLPAIAAAFQAKKVQLKCDAVSMKALASNPSLTNVVPATEEDFKTEFLDLTMAVRVVDSLADAIDHINTHGSGHTDTIVTTSESVAEEFMQKVDSAGTYWNASTRFADGFRYGFGAEIGVSTNKTHARGPVGLDGLVIYKYKLRGQGHMAGSFGVGEGKERFLHEPLPL